MKLKKVQLTSGGSHYLLSAQINGHKAYLIVDTGATDSVITAKFIFDNDMLKDLSESHKSVTGSNSTEPQKVMELVPKMPTVIGGWEIPNTKFLMMDMDAVREIYRIAESPESMDGLIGTDILEKCGAIIDIKKCTIKFRT